MKETLRGVRPSAEARIRGSEAYPSIDGTIRFYKSGRGTLTAVQVAGLPRKEGPCGGRIFGFHIHEGGVCGGNEKDPFSDTGGHYNPWNCPHPEHAGDMPALFGDQEGRAMMIFYTDRFQPEEIAGRTVVIHDMPDDFHTQPSGASGTKIACGEIFAKHQAEKGV